MRRSLTVLSPIAAGALVFVLAASYPASMVRGSGLTGPAVPKAIAHMRLGPDYRARWGDRDRVIVLRVRDGVGCAPRLRRETSTGPGRIEVSVERGTGPACLVRPRWWSIRLTPPPVRATHQSVGVLVDGDWTGVRAPQE